jgi:hypothetical protein
MKKVTERVPFSVLSEDVQQKVVMHWWKTTFGVDYPNRYRKVKQDLDLSLQKTGDFNPVEIIKQNVTPFLVHSNELFSRSGNSARFGIVSPNIKQHRIIAQSYHR